MAGPRGPTYRFGPFTLDAGRRTLSHGETRLSIADRQMDALLFLVAHPGQNVTKDELITAAWHGDAVGDNSIVQAVARLRKALGVHPGGEGYIETAQREGYRFMEPVTRDE